MSFAPGWRGTNTINQEFEARMGSRIKNKKHGKRNTTQS